jgi:hypothetical protein
MSQFHWHCNFCNKYLSDDSSITDVSDCTITHAGLKKYKILLKNNNINFLKNNF